MKSALIQEWSTIRGSGALTVVQPKADWLDVSEFADAIFWIEVSGVTDPGGGVSLLLETAPADVEQLFVPVDSVDVLAASSTPLVRKAFMNGVGGVPLARYLRWKLRAPGGAGTWGATFRIHASFGDGVRSAFSPLALPNLVLWMRADLGVTLETGNKVSTWLDQTGLSNRFASQSTDASRPIWTPNAIGGRPALDFAGSKFLQNIFTDIVSAGSACSVLLVAKNGNGALFTLRRTTTYSSTKFHLANTYVYGDGVNGFANMTVSNTLAKTQSATNAFKSAHIYAGTGQPATIYLNTANETVGAGQQTSESGSTGFFIGTNAANEFWNGLIAEIIVTSGQIAAADRLRVEQYQRDFFGV